MVEGARLESVYAGNRIAGSNPAPSANYYVLDIAYIIVFLGSLFSRHKRDAAAVEDLDELGKIGERARQPVDLIDDDHIDLACLDIGDQPFQGRPLHRAAGKPAIIVERRQHRPAFVLLRENEGGAGFPLGVERVEGLLQTLLRRFPGVNRTACLLVERRGVFSDSPIAPPVARALRTGR